MRYEAVLSDAEMLAVAVLRGDEHAALLLADEVLLTYGARGQAAVHGPTLASFDWPVRLRNALRNGGIETVAQLVAMTKFDVLDVRNIGYTSLHAINEGLAAKGLKLAVR